MVTESFSARCLAGIQTTIAGKKVFTERDLLTLLTESVQHLKVATPEERLEFVIEGLTLTPSADFGMQWAIKVAVGVALRSGVPLNALNAVRLVELASHRRVLLPHKALLTALEGAPKTPALAEALMRLRPNIDEWIGGTEMRELHKRIDGLLHGTEEQPISPVADWSRQVFQEVAKSPKQFEWHALFLHARSLTQSSASRKWMAEAQELVNKIGREEVLDAARRWLALGPTPELTQDQTPEAEADYQKGFVWALGALGDTSIAPDIANFAFACFRKIPMIGAVSHKAGNACVNALAVMPGLDAVSQLSRLAARIKYDVAKRLIEKALEEAAKRNNVSRDDLEAMSVPAFGLDAEGVRIEKAGDCEAVLLIEDGNATIQWTRDGKALKSVPASVKSGHGEIVTEMKKAAKELGTTLATQRIRLERLLLSESACAFLSWKEWYLDHPVVSYFASRLIWEVEDHSSPGGSRQTVIPFKGGFVDWAGNAVEPAADANVRLWHPMRSELQEVLGWRCWLEDHGVRQPFKQAHREVYILTDAERQSRDHSNRFAAHILKQHSFAALCRERGWQFDLMGRWDSHNTPTLDLPRHKLRVEFDVGFPLDENDTTAHQIYLTIRTEAVRFKALPEKSTRGAGKLHPTNIPAMLAALQTRMPQALPLESIPPVVFSEVMRDIDLFIGVTSIGADPAWNEDPTRATHGEYWNQFAFGELAAAAENRRDIVASLLPKLGIRDRCRIEGRFLHVRGDLYEYKIHLGSGNVMCEPGSRYLCIVQGPGDSASSLQLPFEGDRILSMILSKAILLANDTKIKDKTILTQLSA